MEFFDPYRYIKRLQAARARLAESPPAAEADADITGIAEAPALLETVSAPPASAATAEHPPKSEAPERPGPLAGIAETLRVERVRRGLTQRQLGQLAGVPQSHISKIESGAVDLRLTSLFEIARILDLSVRLEPLAPADQ